MIWRDTGILEEVKENKQSLTLPEMEYKWEREYYRNWIKLDINADNSNISILEKLREFLTKRYTEIKWTAMKSIEYGQWKGIAEALRELNLLTSLENSSKISNSSQFTPWQEEVAQWPHEPCTWNMGNEEATEAIRKSDEYNEKHFPWYKDLKEKNQKESDALFWKPTPWQEIEVSDDWDKWYTSVFKKKEFDGFWCKNDWVWLFARPIEDKIELLPPHEFSYDSQTEFEMIVMRRLEILTNTINKLINK